MPVKLARFYPIVPDVDWLARIVPLGVKLVQLRIKDSARDGIVKQTRRALDITRAHDCQLILNDYWDVALETGADFVHLGQEDLAHADLAAIRAAGIVKRRCPSLISISTAGGNASRTSKIDVPCKSAVGLFPPFGVRTSNCRGTVRSPT